MRRLIFIGLLFFCMPNTWAQQYTLSGDVLDEKAAPLLYATVTLLNPADSTLAFFGITNSDGHFEIKSVTAGKYLLQSAFLGYKTIYKSVEVPLQSGTGFGAMIMKPSAVALKEAEVNGERIPILIKKDTIEYDAAAYKTKPDAAAEDLLKKLPGVEVDRAGNIRAQGEDVKNVLVDGKEFFGSDPQVATKNIPADAIKKVQVYDKKTDEAEMTGVDDGSRNKTINLLLKDDRKSAWLGDVLAGGGTDNHYETSAKAYRFTKENQFAVLGMLNNTNKFGFSFRDYLDFNGGMGRLMDGSGDFRISINDDDNLPINFGQPVMGLITSGAGGLNYTYEKKKDHRFNISYLGNGADKNLVETRNTRNFTPGNSFNQDENADRDNKSRAHRFNFGWRNKIDSMQNISVKGSASLTNGKNSDRLFSESFREDSLLNNLNSKTDSKVTGFSGNALASYLKIFQSNWKFVKISVDGSYNRSLRKKEWENATYFISTGDLLSDHQYQNNQNDLAKVSLSALATRKIWGKYFLQPEIKAGVNNETLDRQQGIIPSDAAAVDSLSPHLVNQYQYLRPSLSLKRSSDKVQLKITAGCEAGMLDNSLRNDSDVSNNVFYFTPGASWEYEYSKGRRLRAFYETGINTPEANQLLPTTDGNNPLQLFYGNRNLKPEYHHDVRFNWILFDQFSFTSVFFGIGGTYTRDKINFSRAVGDNLQQTVSLTNVPEDYRTDMNVDFSTPVRKLKINTNINIREKWNKGINLVNNVQNINTNFSHELTISIDNRKKDKWDVSLGGTFNLTQAMYSIYKALNSNYYNLSGFTEISYSPSDKWHFMLTGDLTNYSAQTGSERINVPLLSAEISRYFLKSNRGVITIAAFDILDKNTGIQQKSELNYFERTQSNMIGRYVMLTLKYRLNKFDDKKGMDVQVSHR